MLELRKQLQLPIHQNGERCVVKSEKHESEVLRSRPAIQILCIAGSGTADCAPCDRTGSQ